MKADSMKKHVYRVGDKVRILVPAYITRVGYPLVWTDLVDEITDCPRAHAAWQALGYHLDHTGRRGWKGMSWEFVRAVAMSRVEERGFGGNERKILYRADQPLHEGQYGCAGSVHEIYRKYVRKTGTRFAAQFGYCHDGEPWEEPGGLEDEKTHIILNLGPGEIESIHVEPA